MFEQKPSALHTSSSDVAPTPYLLLSTAEAAPGPVRAATLGEKAVYRELHATTEPPAPCLPPLTLNFISC